MNTRLPTAVRWLPLTSQIRPTCRRRAAPCRMASGTARPRAGIARAFAWLREAALLTVVPFVPLLALWLVFRFDALLRGGWSG